MRRTSRIGDRVKAGSLKTGPDRASVIVVAVLLYGTAAFASSPRIALVPLDSRPPCNSMAVLVGQAGGVDVITPPGEWLGALDRPGDCERILEWLRGEAPRCAAAVVSLDMITDGGLVASRTPATPADVALRRARALADIRQLLPRGAPLFVFDTIQRIAPTTLDAETGDLAARIAEYVHCASEADATGDAEIVARAARLRERVPDAALEDYYRARQRNHRVNLALLEQLRQGVVDFAVLGLDDTAVYGPHVPEVARLRAVVAEWRLGGRLGLYPAADEAAMVLISRATQAIRGIRLRVDGRIVPEGAAREIQPYEERPLADTVRDEIRAAGARWVAPGCRADLHLVVVARAPQGMSEAEYATQVDAAAERVASLARAGRPVAVADISTVNMASRPLIEALRRHMRLAELAGYSGWGTPANALGSALAEGLQAVAGSRLRGADRATAQRANLVFLAERFADDYAYLSLVRPEVAEAQGVRGYSLRLGDQWASVDATVAARLIPTGEALWRQEFGHAAIELYGASARLRFRTFDVHLPWPRMFEIELSTTASTLP